jgi:hypoxanthine phosphoribosyltransferase
MFVFLFVFSLRNDRSLPMSLEFIRTRSYINDHSSDRLEIIGLSDLNVLKNKHLLIIEDIIDRGVTMVELKKNLEKFQPKTIHVVSLFTKRREDKNCVFKPDYCGFEIPDHFIVGYALVRRK